MAGANAPKRKVGIVRGCLTLGVFGFLILCLIAVFLPKGPAPEQPSTTPPTPAAPTVASPQPTPVPALPPPGTPAPGTAVEITGNVLFATRDQYEAVTSGRTPSNALKSGSEKFGVAPGTKARVLGTEGGAVRVEILEESWKGRIGWIGLDGVRTPPTPQESEDDTIRGLTQARRREIYAAYHQAGMRASRLAESRYPLGNIPTDEGEAKRHLAEHKNVYDATKKQARREVLKQYKIDGAQLDAIEREGSEKKWPLGEE